MPSSIWGQLLAVVIFVVAWTGIKRARLRRASADWMLIALNLGVITFYTKSQTLPVILIFFIGVLINFIALSRSPRYGLAATAAIYLPIAFLIIYKIIAPWSMYQLLGVSYICLRVLKFNIEFKNDVFDRPNFRKYFLFLFFYPTFVVGPINSFASFDEKNEINSAVVIAALVRIVVGLGKFYVIAPVLSRLDFDNLWNDGRLHGSFDFLLSCAAYFLFLYCNFSGFIDIMIGTARLCGIELPENFNAPFRSRNVKEFWNRWHITLSQLARDTIFTPLSKNLVRKIGIRYLNLAVATSIFTTFLVIGIWHGNGVNYLLFGAWHGAGLAFNYYYSVFLKKWLGRGLKSYESNKLLQALAITATFVFISISFFFFENSWEQMKTYASYMMRFYNA